MEEILERWVCLTDPVIKTVMMDLDSRSKGTISPVPKYVIGSSFGNYEYYLFAKYNNIQSGRRYLRSKHLTITIDIYKKLKMFFFYLKCSSSILLYLFVVMGYTNVKVLNSLMLVL